MKRRTSENTQTPAEFAKDHWKEIAAVSGTLAGAVILLMIRYHKKRKAESGDDSQDRELDVYEEEATGGNHDTPMLLETGVPVAKHIPDSDTLSEELASGLRGKARQFMKTLGHLKHSK